MSFKVTTKKRSVNNFLDHIKSKKDSTFTSCFIDVFLRNWSPFFTECHSFNLFKDKNVKNSKELSKFEIFKAFRALPSNVIMELFMSFRIILIKTSSSRMMSTNMHLVRIKSKRAYYNFVCNLIHGDFKYLEATPHGRDIASSFENQETVHEIIDVGAIAEGLPF